MGMHFQIFFSIYIEFFNVTLSKVLTKFAVLIRTLSVLTTFPKCLYIADYSRNSRYASDVLWAYVCCHWIGNKIQLTFSHFWTRPSAPPSTLKLLRTKLNVTQNIIFILNSNFVWTVFDRNWNGTELCFTVHDDLFGSIFWDTNQYFITHLFHFIKTFGVFQTEFDSDSVFDGD